MSQPQFFETRMGQKFYEGTMPRIAKALEELVKEITVLNAALSRRNEEEKK